MKTDKPVQRVINVALVVFFLANPGRGICEESEIIGGRKMTISAPDSGIWIAAVVRR